MSAHCVSNSEGWFLSGSLPCELDPARFDPYSKPSYHGMRHFLGHAASILSGASQQAGRQLRGNGQLNAGDREFPASTHRKDLAESVVVCCNLNW